MNTRMKTMMVAAAVVVAGMSAGSALAWGGKCEGPRSGKAAWHQMERGEMQERMSARLEQLETALALRDDQRAGWDAWKETMDERAGRGGEHRAAMRDGERPQTAIKRMERMETFAAARIEAMAGMRKATEAFYATLDETQRSIFDEQFGKGPRGEGRRSMGSRSSS